MDHGEHHSPRPRWTRIVGVPTSPPSPPTTAGDLRPPSSPGRNDDHDHLAAGCPSPSPSRAATATATIALYGPGELELHRHALLRRSVERAGLRVWYPGSWMGHSPRAYFRAHCRPPPPSSTDDDGVEDDDDADGSRRGAEDDRYDEDDNGGDVEVLMEFRSNARLISAEMTMQNADGGSPAPDDDNDVDDEFHDGDDCPDRSDPGEESKGEGGGEGVEVATTAASRRGTERYSTIRAGGGRRRRLLWTTTAVRGGAAADPSDEDGGTAYDHVILVPRRPLWDRRGDGGGVRTSATEEGADHRRDKSGARCDDPARRSAPSSWAVVLELDASRRRRRPPAGGHDGDEGGGGGNDATATAAATAGREGGVEIDAMDPPPCISLICPPFSTPSLLASSTSVADRNRRLMPHDRRRRLFASSWEWRRSVDDEWTPIDSSWALSCDDDDHAPREEGRRVNDGGRPNDAGDASSLWRFPHQADLCRVSAVRPASMMSSHEDGDGGGSGGRRRVVICDFGREMLGRVRASMPSTADDAPSSSGGAAAADASPPRRRRRRPPPPALTLRVGETMAEAANDDEDRFEQRADVSYYMLEGGGSENTTTMTMTNGEDRDRARGGDADDDGTTVGTAAAGRRPRHVWVSRHLLAFRYVRVVVEFPGDDGDEIRQSSSSSDISVECLAHLPLLYRRGKFSCYDGGGGDGTSHSSGAETSCVPEERDLDSRIWHAAAYTLQLCTHQNFIVDGESIRKSIHCIYSFFLSKSLHFPPRKNRLKTRSFALGWRFGREHRSERLQLRRRGLHSLDPDGLGTVRIGRSPRRDAGRE